MLAPDWSEAVEHILGLDLVDERHEDTLRGRGVPPIQRGLGLLKLSRLRVGHPLVVDGAVRHIAVDVGVPPGLRLLSQ